MRTTGGVPYLQAVHLVQAARLVAAGHEEQIAARFDDVREPLVESDDTCRRDPGDGREAHCICA